MFSALEESARGVELQFISNCRVVVVFFLHLAQEEELGLVVANGNLTKQMNKSQLKGPSSHTIKKLWGQTTVSLSSYNGRTTLIIYHLEFLQNVLQTLGLFDVRAL